MKQIALDYNVIHKRSNRIWQRQQHLAHFATAVLPVEPNPRSSFRSTAEIWWAPAPASSRSRSCSLAQWSSRSRLRTRCQQPGTAMSCGRTAAWSHRAWCCSLRHPKCGLWRWWCCRRRKSEKVDWFWLVFAICWHLSCGIVLEFVLECKSVESCLPSHYYIYKKLFV